MEFTSPQPKKNMPRYKSPPMHRVSDVRGAFYWLRRRLRIRKRPCSSCQSRESHIRSMHKHVLQLESENRYLREENHSLREEDRQTYSRVQKLINDIAMPRSRSHTHSSLLSHQETSSLSFYSVRSSDDNTVDYDPHEASPYTII